MRKLGRADDRQGGSIDSAGCCHQATRQRYISPLLPMPNCAPQIHWLIVAGMMTTFKRRCRFGVDEWGKDGTDRARSPESSLPVGNRRGGIAAVLSARRPFGLRSYYPRSGITRRPLGCVYIYPRSGITRWRGARQRTNPSAQSGSILSSGFRVMGISQLRDENRGKRSKRWECAAICIR